LVSETKNNMSAVEVIGVLPQLVHLIGPECVIKCLLLLFLIN
jgi:hypothetical protein